ncbi:putative toxin-antitoxin system toxin component, PIN family [bacterium]|nr:putative toxin-antitoxin system toxin component, PIN family [bacterium]
MLVTIDTNVLYQALRSSLGASFQIMQLVRAGRCRMALSQPVFTEYQDVLTRQSSLDAFELTRNDVEKILRYIAYVGRKTDPHFLFRPNLKDENDNMFVELAIASQSRYLVTSNTKDFVSGELLLNNFQLFSPAQFLKNWRRHYE